MNEEHHLELNAWSRGLVIGGISLSPKFLLSQPIDKFGRATLLLKLTDENQVTSGKLKVACVYSPDVSEFALDSEAQKQKAIDEMVRLGLYFTSHCQSIELPATAKVIKVSVIDLVSVHFTKPNSPRVKLACDRQVAATTIAVRGGAHAQWVGMEWKFDIHKVSRSWFKGKGTPAYDYLSSIGIILDFSGDLGREIDRYPGTIRASDCLDTHEQ